MDCKGWKKKFQHFTTCFNNLTMILFELITRKTFYIKKKDFYVGTNKFIFFKISILAPMIKELFLPKKIFFFCTCCKLYKLKIL